MCVRPELKKNWGRVGGRGVQWLEHRYIYKPGISGPPINTSQLILKYFITTLGQYAIFLLF